MLQLLDQLVSQTRKSIPARINSSLVATALRHIQILAAVRAKPFAVRLAESTCGQGKQHLLTHYILKQKPAFSIIAYFRLIFGNRSFTGVRIGTFGAKNEVEGAGEGYRNRIHAAGAEDFELAGILGADTDVFYLAVAAAMLNQEVGLALDGQRAQLVEIDCEFQDAGSDGFVELKRLVSKLDRSNEHTYRLRG
jgi:hypothetical protein